MLKRREFLKLSSLLASGAVLALATTPSAMEWHDAGATGAATTGGSVLPNYHFSGHARSGCSFRPELTDLWAGGGAQLPDLL